jgi:small subunit ribosomal protein S1
METTGSSSPTPPQPAGSTDRAALDAELMREIEDALGGMSLEDMVGGDGGKAMRHAAPVKGERTLRAGTVIRVHDGEVFIEFDPKRQGVCPVAQFGENPPNPGEKHEFFEERFDPFEQLWVCSRPGATHKGELDSLSAGMIVEARCVGMNKGGLDMEVSHHKAFMPAGQVDIRHIEDISVFLGEKFPCKIIELRREKGRMVLSRKAVLLEERARMRDQVLAELEVGQVRTATVTSIQQYGAFADLGGVDGLIHIGDISHERIKDAGDVLKPGQVVQVKVLRIDREAKPIKIGLGLKQTIADPALTAMAEIEAGATVTGRVTKLMDFGAFVELSPGVEGLIHVSEIAHERIPTPGKVLQVGEVLQVKVLSVDPGRKRISLSRKALLDRPAMPERGDRRDGREAPALRADDPVMRKLRAKFGGRELKGGLG